MNRNEALSTWTPKIVQALFECGEFDKVDFILRLRPFIEHQIKESGVSRLLHDLDLSTDAETKVINRAITQSAHILANSPDQLLFQLDLREPKLAKNYFHTNLSEPNEKRYLTLIARPSDGLGLELIKTIKTSWEKATIIRGRQLATRSTNQVLVFEFLEPDLLGVVGSKDNEFLRLNTAKSTNGVTDLENDNILGAGYNLTAADVWQKEKPFYAWAEESRPDESKEVYSVGYSSTYAGRVTHLLTTKFCVTALLANHELGWLLVGMPGRLELRNSSSGNLKEFQELETDGQALGVRALHFIEKSGVFVVDAVTELLVVDACNFEIRWRINYWETARQMIKDMPFQTQFERILILDDSKLLATDNKNTWVLDLITGRKIQEYDRAYGVPVCLADNYAVFIDKEICSLVDLQTFSSIASFESPTGGFVSVRYNSDRHELVSFHSEGSIRFWDLDTILETGSVSKEENTIRGLCGVEACSWTDHIFAYDADGNIYKLDKEGQAGTIQARLGSEITFLKLHGKQPLIAVGAKNGSLFVWNPLTMKTVVRTSFGGAPVTDLCFVEDSNFMIVLTETSMRLLSLTTQEIGAAHGYVELSNLKSHWVGKVLPDSQHLFCANDSGEFAIVDFRSSKLVARWGGALSLWGGTPKIFLSPSGNRAFVRVGIHVYLIDFSSFNMKLLTPYGFSTQEYSLNLITSQKYFLADGNSKIPLQGNSEVESALWSANEFLKGIGPFQIMDVSSSEEIAIGARKNELFLIDFVNEIMLDRVSFESEIRSAKFSTMEDRVFIIDESGEFVVLELHHRPEKYFCANSLMAWSGKTYCNCIECPPDIELFGQNWKKCASRKNVEDTHRCSGCLGDVHPASTNVSSNVSCNVLFQSSNLGGHFDEKVCKLCGDLGKELMVLNQNFAICRECTEQYATVDLEAHKGVYSQACRSCRSSKSDNEDMKFFDLKFQVICETCFLKIRDGLKNNDFMVAFEEGLSGTNRRRKAREDADNRRPFIWQFLRRITKKKKKAKENHDLPGWMLRDFLRGKKGASEYVFNRLLDWGAVNVLRIALKKGIMQHPADIEGAMLGEKTDGLENLELIAFTMMHRVPPIHLEKFSNLLSSSMPHPGAYLKFANTVSDYPFYWCRQAEIAYNMAIELVPEVSEIRIKLAMFLAEKLHRPEDAKRHFDIAIQISSNDDAIFKSARFHFNFMSDIEEHKWYEDKLLSLARASPYDVLSILEERAEQMVQKGKIDKASELLHELAKLLKKDKYWHKKTNEVLEKLKEVIPRD